jgi:hypothetical protein
VNLAKSFVILILRYVVEDEPHDTHHTCEGLVLNVPSRCLGLIASGAMASLTRACGDSVSTLGTSRTKHFKKAFCNANHHRLLCINRSRGLCRSRGSDGDSWLPAWRCAVPNREKSPPLDLGDAGTVHVRILPDRRDIGLISGELLSPILVQQDLSTLSQFQQNGRIYGNSK